MMGLLVVCCERKKAGRDGPAFPYTQFDGGRRFGTN